MLNSRDELLLIVVVIVIFLVLSIELAGYGSGDMLTQGRIVSKSELAEERMILRKRLASSNETHGGVLEVLTLAAQSKPFVYFTQS